MTCAPVAFLIFNRPNETARVFERIRQARPSTLLVIADGPRNDAEHDVVERTRAIVQKVNWPCDVRVNASATNLGCRKRVSSGIDWVFNEVNRAIILEDDCLPHPSFFRFCEELLGRYEDDKRVMHISGDNFQFGQRTTRNSYYFSAMNHCWGWATWSRAWREYDVSMREWPAARETSLLTDLWGPGPIAQQFHQVMDRVHAGEIDTWDTQWTFACWRAGGVSILPATNLVTNIGFGAGATHTRAARSIVANLPVEAMEFPLTHPRQVARDAEADVQTVARLVEVGNI